MKVLILGGAGMLGPYVVPALHEKYDLRVTDIKPLAIDFRGEFRQVDVANAEQVMDAAAGMDAIVNLSVLRQDRQLAFDVSTLGCYNMAFAASSTPAPTLRLPAPVMNSLILTCTLTSHPNPAPISMRSPSRWGRRSVGSLPKRMTFTSRPISSTTSATLRIYNASMKCAPLLSPGRMRRKSFH